MPLTIRGGINGVIGITVSLLVAAVLFPIALTMIATAALTSVNAAVITVWQIVVPVVSVVGILMFFIGSSD